MTDPKHYAAVSAEEIERAAVEHFPLLTHYQGAFRYGARWAAARISPVPAEGGESKLALRAASLLAEYRSLDDGTDDRRQKRSDEAHIIIGELMDVAAPEPPREGGGAGIAPNSKQSNDLTRKSASEEITPPAETDGKCTVLKDALEQRELLERHRVRPERSPSETEGLARAVKDALEHLRDALGDAEFVLAKHLREAISRAGQGGAER